MTRNTYSFVQYTFIIYLICTYHMPGTVLDPRNAVVKKEITDSIICLNIIFILVGAKLISNYSILGLNNCSKIKIEQVFSLYFSLLDALTSEVYRLAPSNTSIFCYNVTFSVSISLASLFKISNAFLYFLWLTSPTSLLYIYFLYTLPSSYFIVCLYINLFIYYMSPPLKYQLHDDRNLFLIFLCTALFQNLGHYLECTRQ